MPSVQSVAAVLDSMALEVCNHNDKAMRLGKNVEIGMTKMVLWSQVY